jgi:hypothetical protein
MTPMTEGRGFWLWYSTLSGPIWWMIHITGVSALASGACGHGSYLTAAHLLTVVTGLATALAVFNSFRLLRAPASETVRFLGRFGVFIGALSLLLILLEESYVWTVRVCGP